MATDPPLTPALCSLCGHEQTEHVGCAHGWGPGSLAPGKGGCECDGPAGAEAELLALRRTVEKSLDIIDHPEWFTRHERTLFIEAARTLLDGRAGDPPVVAEPER